MPPHKTGIQITKIRPPKNDNPRNYDTWEIQLYCKKFKFGMNECMYGIPKDLNLSPVVKEFTTQIRVGQFDLQFNFGDVCFVIESPVTLYRDGNIFARWESGKWPDPGFYEIMNIEVTSCEIANDKLIVIEFKNGVTMHLVDDSEQYECMQISIKNDPTLWVI